MAWKIGHKASTNKYYRDIERFNREEEVFRKLAVQENAKADELNKSISTDRWGHTGVLLERL